MTTVACTIWFTGLSGSGKTTSSRCVADLLREREQRVEVLEGDVIRKELSTGLGFSREDRDTNVRRIGFFCDAPLAILEERDPKGLYSRARSGEIRNFTGIDDPYESPLDPEVVVHSDGSETPQESAAKILLALERLGYLTSLS